MATTKYHDQVKSDPKFKFPQMQLDDLREFNVRRKELFISKSTSPTITASILTAQSSVRRMPPNQPASTGVSRAKKIRLQARHLLLHHELVFSQTGFKTSHPSILDDQRVREGLFNWAAQMKPGEVSSLSLFCLLYIHIVDR